MLSVVIPAYNESGLILNTAKVVADLLKSNKIEYEILFVNDGSKDDTWSEICQAHDIDSNVKGLSFSRNFGKEGAVLAGLSSCKGDCAVVMDADLQHPPKTILSMYKLWQDGYEVVEGVKKTRGKENFCHTLLAKTFYKIMSNSTGIDMSKASDFKLLDRKVIDTFISLPERHIFFRGLSSWVGYKVAYVDFEVAERQVGESKWNFKSLFKYAVNNITAFSNFPVKVIIFLGTISFAFSVIFGIYSLVKYFEGGSLEGFTTVILLILFFGSVLIISIGIVGYYISKVYDEIKMRPRFIISERID